MKSETDTGIFKVTTEVTSFEENADVPADGVGALQRPGGVEAGRLRGGPPGHAQRGEGDHRGIAVLAQHAGLYVPPRRAFIEHAAMSWLMWLAHGALIAATILAWPNALVLACSVVTLAAMWIVVTAVVRQECRMLQAPPIRLTVPPLALARPLINTSYRLRELRHKKSNYTTYI